MWARARCLLLAAAVIGAGCQATVDGGQLPEVDGDLGGNPPGGLDPGGDDGDDDPLVPGDDEDPGIDDPLPPPPEGPAGTCWGDVAFDQACSRDRASGDWGVALFPGDAARSAMVSTNVRDNAAIVSWGPAGAASSVGWSDALVAMLPGQADNGRFLAVRLVTPGAARDSMKVVHANGASTAADFRTHWQDEPTGLQSPGFSSAYQEVDGQSLTWRASAIAGGVQMVHVAEIDGVEHEHTIQIGNAGPTSFAYRRLEGGAEVESWTSDDGRRWNPVGGGGDRILETLGEQLEWSLPLPAGFAGEGIALSARHAAWGEEMGWLEGEFAGLSAPLVGGFAAISDLWVDVDAAMVRSFTVVFWDGAALQEWDASGGSFVDGQEFPATYQTDRGDTVEVSSDGRAVASVEAVAEESQVRVVVSDLLPVGEGEGRIATAYRWEIVFESHDALATGEVAVQKTDETGCTRQLSYDFGASWAVEACR